MKLLLIEDDKRTSEFVLKGLEQAGYAVETAFDGADGLLKAASRKFDLAIIDIMLPTLDGLSVIGELRKRGIATPVIVLSAKDSVDDKIKGLQQGGDDYLAKPFAFSELLARIQALLRRAISVAEPASLSYADLMIDLLSRKVMRGELRIDIQPMEYSLLEYLMRNAGRVVSRTMIMEHVWDYNFDPQTNVVEARICRLRDKVDRSFERKLIHTVRGFGYVLK